MSDSSDKSLVPAQHAPPDLAQADPPKVKKEKVERALKHLPENPELTTTKLEARAFLGEHFCDTKTSVGLTMATETAHFLMRNMQILQARIEKLDKKEKHTQHEGKLLHYYMSQLAHYAEQLTYVLKESGQLGRLPTPTGPGPVPLTEHPTNLPPDYTVAVYSRPAEKPAITVDTSDRSNPSD